MPHSTRESRIRDVVRQRVLTQPGFNARNSRKKMTWVTAEALAARADFLARWDALTQEGLSAGHIDWSDGDGDTHLEPVTTTVYADGQEWTESEARYAERVEAEVDVQTAHAISKMERNLS